MLRFLFLGEPISLQFLTLGHCEQPADSSVFQHFVKQYVQRLQQEANTVCKAQMTPLKYFASKHCCSAPHTNAQTTYTHRHAFTLSLSLCLLSLIQLICL